MNTLARIVAFPFVVIFSLLWGQKEAEAHPGEVKMTPEEERYWMNKKDWEEWER